MRTFYFIDGNHPAPIPVVLDDDQQDGRYCADVNDAWDELEREAKAWISLASRNIKRAEEMRQKALEDLARAAEFATAVFRNRERSEG